ncbi:tail fiber protein [Escherichia coli]|nr:tail fiber protein [Escherichia coli]EIR2435307.1 tail fiber protein [Escherichia coli]EJC7841292.1 tail fiber protein [Escherichia coli]ELT3573270.1 tail fiber protein [Escherichia coli]ELT3624079.1 tail fiber protein [Escherichia coli]ELT3781078.1 tail fiber protein [Escherichia coli]
MHRIDTKTAQKDKFGAGKNGFTRGNPQTGTPATDLDDDYFDMLQEELCSVVEASGASLEKGRHDQLLTALRALLLSRKNPFGDIKSDGTVKTALENLSLGEGSALPVGVPVPWPSATPPTGWIKCNGAPFSAEEYPELAKVYPALKLPDLRGEFIRGWDDGRGVDSGRVVLTGQSQSVQQHTHDLAMAYSSETADRDRLGTTPDSDMIPIKDMINVTTFNGSGWVYLKANGSTGAETRPRNLAFNYIVRAV